MSQKENKNLKKHNVEQGTDEWFALRNEHPLTASNAQAIGNAGKGLETLVWGKLSEKYSTADRDTYTNKDLARGTELEPIAREMYELETGNKTEIVGFVTNKLYEKAGASPDAYSGEGLVEIKCFADTKHFQMVVDFKKSGTFKIESQYEWQMQQQMLITEKEWCDFVAYNPNFKQSLLIQRVVVDKEKQKKLIEGIKKGRALIKEIEKLL